MQHLYQVGTPGRDAAYIYLPFNSVLFILILLAKLKFSSGYNKYNRLHIYKHRDDCHLLFDSADIQLLLDFQCAVIASYCKFHKCLYDPSINTHVFSVKCLHGI